MYINSLAERKKTSGGKKTGSQLALERARAMIDSAQSVQARQSAQTKSLAFMESMNEGRNAIVPDELSPMARLKGAADLSTQKRYIPVSSASEKKPVTSVVDADYYDTWKRERDRAQTVRPQTTGLVPKAVLNDDRIPEAVKQKLISGQAITAEDMAGLPVQGTVHPNKNEIRPQERDAAENIAYNVGAWLAPESANSGNILNNLRYPIARLVAGALGFGEGLGDFLVGGAADILGEGAYMLGANGAGDIYKGASETLKNSNIAEAFREGVAGKTKQVDRLNEFAGDIYENAGQLIPNILTGQAVSGATGLAADGVSKALIGITAGESAAQEARSEGASDADAAAYGLASGLLEATIESISGGIPGLGEGATGKLMNKLKNSPATVKWLVDVLGEGGEEALSTVLTPMLKRMTYDPNAENATAEEILYSALQGSAFSAITQAGSLPQSIAEDVNAIRSRGQNAKTASVGTEASADVDVKTASTGEAGRLDNFTDREVENFMTGIKNKILGHGTNLVDFVQNAISDKTNTDKLYLGKVSEATATTIKMETGLDVSGFNVVLPSDRVRHIFKHHGDTGTETARSQIAVTPEDFFSLEETISDPDKVYLSEKTDRLGRPVLMFEKDMGNILVTAQAVTSGRQTLSTDTLYIVEKTPSDGSDRPVGVSPSTDTVAPNGVLKNPPLGSNAEGTLDPEIYVQNGPLQGSNNNISATSENVNSENTTNDASNIWANPSTSPIYNASPLGKIGPPRSIAEDMNAIRAGGQNTKTAPVGVEAEFSARPDDVAQVYRLAGETQRQLDGLLSDVADRLGIDFEAAGQKSMQSMADKVQRKSKAGAQYSIYDMKDHARGKLELSSFEQIPEVLRLLDEKNIPWSAEAVGPTEWGYRGFHVTFRDGKGISSEIQLTRPDVWRVKLESDKIYEKWRNVTDQNSLSDAEYGAMMSDMQYSVAMWNQLDLPDFSTYIRNSSSESTRALNIASADTGAIGFDQMPLISSRTRILGSGETSNMRPNSVMHAMESPPFNVDSSIAQNDGKGNGGFSRNIGAKPNYLANLLSNPDNRIIHDKEAETNSQVNPRLNELSGIVNELSTAPDNSIFNPPEKINNDFSQGVGVEAEFSARPGDVAQVYRLAGETQRQLDGLLSDVADRLGIDFEAAGQKSMQSMSDKVQRKSKAGAQYSVYDMKDHTRGKLELSSFEQIPEVLRLLDEKNIPWSAEAVGPTEWGYRGFHVTFRDGNGISSEIQLTRPDVWRVKLESDKIYEKWRNVDTASLTAIGRLSMRKDVKRSIAMWSQLDLPDFSKYIRNSSSESTRALYNSSPNSGDLAGIQAPLTSSFISAPVAKKSDVSNTRPDSVMQAMETPPFNVDSSIAQNDGKGNSGLPRNIGANVDMTPPLGRQPQTTLRGGGLHRGDNER